MTEMLLDQNLNQAAAVPSFDSFVDRRANVAQGAPLPRERRQFGDGRDELSPAARELADAVDQYKLHHRRRFITYEEMVGVLRGLGYNK